MKRTAPLLDLTPHEQKYDDLANWLGIAPLQVLVPFLQREVDYALTTLRDEHLNTLLLRKWDRQNNLLARLVRTAIHRDKAAGIKPLTISWSLSYTVCVLKHVARFYPREEG